MSELSQTLAMPNAPHISFSPNSRYPDSAVEVLEPEFLKYRVYSSSVEQLASGCRWSEGPQWFGDHHCLLWSDIPGNRILRWDEASGSVSSFREPSNQANGLARDRQGRLLACEHLTRRVTRTEIDGSITVLADRFDGKRLNSPNDSVCQRDAPYSVNSARRLVHRSPVRHPRLVGGRTGRLRAAAGGLSDRPR